MNTEWHFFVMIFASLLVFFAIIRIVLPRQLFYQKMNSIILLSVVVVVIGMLFGKYGASLGLPWWVYYPVPMFMTVFLPPLVLKLKGKRLILYLLLSFLSAPFIHVLFSFLLGWQEYMPFWEIPSIHSLLY